MFKHVYILAAVLILPILAFAGEDSEKPFVKKRYSIHGSASIQTVDGATQVIFSEDFRTKIKLYLSKIPLSTLLAEDVGEYSVRLSVLKSHKGTQTYIIPEDIDLSEYKSVIIHCEAYTVLWGGFDL